MGNISSSVTGARSRLWMRSMMWSNTPSTGGWFACPRLITSGCRCAWLSGNWGVMTSEDERRRIYRYPLPQASGCWATTSVGVPPGVAVAPRLGEVGGETADPVRRLSGTGLATAGCSGRDPASTSSAAAQGRGVVGAYCSVAAEETLPGGEPFDPLRVLSSEVLPSEEVRRWPSQHPPRRSAPRGAHRRHDPPRVPLTALLEYLAACARPRPHHGHPTAWRSADSMRENNPDAARGRSAIGSRGMSRGRTAPGW